MGLRLYCGRRGQVFTADFLVACAVVVLLLGITLHSSEMVLRGASSRAAAVGSAPQLLAAGLSGEIPIVSNNSPYCFSISNGSGNCASFSCPNRVVFSSRRLVACENYVAGVCVLEVRSCG